MQEEPTSPALKRFLDIQHRDFDFLKLVNVFAGGVEPILTAARQTNAELAQQLETVWAMSRFRGDFPSFMRTWCEILLTRSVDNFHNYLTDILSLIFGNHPTHPKTEEKVTVREVLDQVTMEQFTDWAIRRKVATLDTFPKARKYIEKELSIALSIDPGLEASITEAVAVRNIVVHNRGIINERFCELVGGNQVGIGLRLEFYADDAMKWQRAVIDTSKIIDRVIVSKFGDEVLKDPEKLKARMSFHS